MIGGNSNTNLAFAVLLPCTLWSVKICVICERYLSHRFHRCPQVLYVLSIIQLYSTQRRKGQIQRGNQYIATESQKQRNPQCFSASVALGTLQNDLCNSLRLCDILASLRGNIYESLYYLRHGSFRFRENNDRRKIGGKTWMAIL